MEKEQKDLIQNMYPELKGKDFEKFIYLCEETNLDPLRNQIYSVKRKTKTDGNWVTSYTTQTSIDGFRLIAERSGKYAPGKEPIINLDKDKNIISATAFVKKMTDDKTWHEVASTAYFEEYAQLDKDGNPTRFWKKMPKLMLSKCAEALTLRKAFPDDLSGIYTDDEMEQADSKEEESKEEKKEKAENKIAKDEECIKDEKLKTINDLFESVPKNLKNKAKKSIFDFLKIKSFEEIKNKQYVLVLNLLNKAIATKDKAEETK